MVLNFPGGVFLPTRTDEHTRLHAIAHPRRVTAAELGEVYLLLGEGYSLACREGEPVQAGSLLATLADGTPLYASVPGTFEGVFAYRGSHYAKVASAGAGADETALQVRPPEQKRLSDLKREELLEAVRTLGVWDIYTGDWLWKRAKKALQTETRRVVVDMTDTDGWSLTGSRAALRAPGEVLNGAKVLLQMLGATKILLIVDRTQRKQAEVFRALINDPSLVVLGTVEPKFPLREETLYDAIYARRLPRGGGAQGEGVFIVRPQTAEALYRALLTGQPQTTRWLTAAGDGFPQDLAAEVPFGAPWQRLLELFGFKEGAYETRLDSPLHGDTAAGVLGGRTESVLAAMPLDRKAGRCIACGRCAEVCPMRLQPYRILQAKSYRAVKELASVCFDCGCCEYVCPAALPLREQIQKHRNPPATT